MAAKFSDIGTRISKRLQDLHMKQADLCRLTGISSNGISQYVTNKRIPDTLSVYKISKSLNVSIEWLLTGEGPTTNESNSSFISLSQLETTMISMYRTLDESNKEDAFDNIKMKYERVTQKEKGKSLFSTYTEETATELTPDESTKGTA